MLYSYRKNSYSRIITLHPVDNYSSVCENEKTNQNSTFSPILSKNDFNNKYRKIGRKSNLFDSIDDEEYLDEESDYYISPNSLFINLSAFSWNTQDNK